jgi:hypothetical protein
MRLAGSIWPDWIGEHESLIVWGGIASVLMFVGTLVVIPIMITRMGEDYFMPDRPKSFAKLHPVARAIGLILKNLLGLIFLLLGILMIFVPGQGLLTILMGLAMLNFPGKRNAELRLVRYPPVRRSINWIRRKATRAPLRIPDPPA